ncbi:MAG TPA: carbohydrate-binding family 9-like protein, partial [Polyangiaceae bacterium]|nr:carbohydrate-binding family 9-like protein [Polyangiaceae bacterium]
ENKVHLVGYKVEPAGKAGPGTDVKITMYWRADDKLDEGWSLFTHILDSNNERVLNIDNVGPLREVKEAHQALWPSAWEKGKVYVDEQTFRVPDEVKTADIAVTSGIWKGDARLKIVNGPGDSENRGIVVRLKTGLDNKPAAAPHTEIPTLPVNKLAKSEKVNIDGKLDDNAWKAAASTGPFVDVGTGNPNSSFPVNGSVKVLWDDTNMYLGFTVEDPDVIGGFPKDAKDPHLWTKDTVEIMLDPDGDGDNNDYYEIQVNPQNLVFDTQFDAYNSPKTDPDGPFGHQDWSAKLKSAVVVDGTLDKPGDKDKGYTVEIALPWASFTKAKNRPPKGGDAWRMNFYAMKTNSGVAWSPILGQGNFHKASRFGRVQWATADQVAPAPSSSAVAAAGAGAAPKVRETAPAVAKSAASAKP